MLYNDNKIQAILSYNDNTSLPFKICYLFII
jgi:hypothetical protein